jgi:hypothetical protein
MVVHFDYMPVPPNRFFWKICEFDIIYVVTSVHIAPD